MCASCWVLNGLKTQVTDFPVLIAQSYHGLPVLWQRAGESVTDFDPDQSPMIYNGNAASQLIHGRYTAVPRWDLALLDSNLLPPVEDEVIGPHACNPLNSSVQLLSFNSLPTHSTHSTAGIIFICKLYRNRFCFRLGVEGELQCQSLKRRGSDRTHHVLSFSRFYFCLAVVRSLRSAEYYFSSWPLR